MSIFDLFTGGDSDQAAAHDQTAAAPTPAPAPAPTPAPAPLANDSGGQSPANTDPGSGGLLQGVGDFFHGLGQEGIGGLMDPSGMLDRQQAQRDLASRFQVVGDDYTGERLPNTVSEEEYEKIARTYSDVRLGRGDLTIDAAAHDTSHGADDTHPSDFSLDADHQAAYRQGAMNDIANMLQTQAGRNEIGQLQNNDPQGTHMHTTMVPLLSGNNTYDTTNGYSAAVDGNPSMGADGTPGAGSNINIRYNPGVNVWDGDPAAASNTWAGQTRSDVLLAHEMTHSIYQSSGTQDETPVQQSDTGVNDIVHGRFGEGIDNILHPPEGNVLDANGTLLRREHQAVGLGLYADEDRDRDIGENAYRRERRAIADGGGPGVIANSTGRTDGDATMVERDTYNGRPAPAPAGP